MEGKDSSEEDEKEKEEEPYEPTRFGWVQGVMVGRVGTVWVLLDICELQVYKTNL